ncbi:fasciclin domain-containing protein [Methanofollis sp. UBA420]|uniref:fasciclin domain-containing protein n=1 Tax=Methanofollis sp. UBA420 TaxID=1915514 RepID=UPI00316AD272
MKKLFVFAFVILCFGAVLIAGCAQQGPAEPTPTPTATTTEETPAATVTTAETTPTVTETGVPTGNETDIFRTLNTMPEYSVLRELLLLAGLDQTLATEGPYTLFAPDNTAFATSLTKDQTNAIRADPALLEPVLLYHVVEGTYTATDLQNVTSLTTLEGSTLKVTVSGDTVMVNGATVVEADIMATNGVIHGIDAVLLPPDVTMPWTTTATTGTETTAAETTTEETTTEETTAAGA